MCWTTMMSQDGRYTGAVPSAPGQVYRWHVELDENFSNSAVTRSDSDECQDLWSSRDVLLACFTVYTYSHCNFVPVSLTVFLQLFAVLLSVPWDHFGRHCSNIHLLLYAAAELKIWNLIKSIENSGVIDLLASRACFTWVLLALCPHNWISTTMCNLLGW